MYPTLDYALLQNHNARVGSGSKLLESRRRGSYAHNTANYYSWIYTLITICRLLIVHFSLSIRFSSLVHELPLVSI